MYAESTLTSCRIARILCCEIERNEIRHKTKGLTPLEWIRYIIVMSSLVTKWGG